MNALARNADNKITRVTQVRIQKMTQSVTERIVGASSQFRFCRSGKFLNCQMNNGKD